MTVLQEVVEVRADLAGRAPAAQLPLGLLLRQLIGVGTPRSLQGRAAAVFSALFRWWSDLWGYLRRLSTFSRPISAKTASSPRHYRFRRYI